MTVTFDNGHYRFFYNTVLLHDDVVAPQAINGQSATTLGYVQGLQTLYGYIDDVSNALVISKEDII